MIYRQQEGDTHRPGIGWHFDDYTRAVIITIPTFNHWRNSIRIRWARQRNRLYVNVMRWNVDVLRHMDCIRVGGEWITQEEAHERGIVT